MKILIIALAVAVLCHEAFAAQQYNIALKADNNKYWTRIPEDSTLVNFVAAQQTYKGAHTSFQRTNLDNGKTMLWSFSAGAYLCRVTRGDQDYIEADKHYSKSRCEFGFEDTGTGWASIKADNGKFLCRERIGATDFIMANGNNACHMQVEVLSA